ncbi:MAG TPA: DNA topoisomerase IV subunit A [Candidatus Nanoarchaeia archaeon]|nr:DNA topoisomerase IV subunit A [Candidatus Nanoarchaeia archaeon]
MSDSKGKTRKEVLEALEAEAKQVLAAIEDMKNPKLKIPLRTLTNVYFDAKAKMIKLGDKEGTRTFYNVGQAKKFMQTMLIAAQLKSLILQDAPTLGTRQLFYLLRGTMPDSDEDKFDEQEESDAIIEDIEVMIDALREELGLIAVPKGVLAGPILIEDLKTGDVLDFTKFGTAGGSVPASVEPDTFKFKKCTADYILVVEKYEVWNLLNQQRYWEKNNCLLMTGKGQPARAERRLLSRFEKELKLPIYVFADLDVYGYYIYSVYKQGSINLAFFSEKAAAPSAKYIGFSVDDYKTFKLPKTALIKMAEDDFKRIKEVKAYEWFKSKEWQQELDKLEKFGYSVESDALVAKSIDFTAKVYLPTKIKNKDWLD